MSENIHEYSFVLPAYKGAHLKEAVRSILNQSYQDFELIIVDDCSPDNLAEIISSFKDERIRFYSNTVNRGHDNLVKQWNDCLAKTNSEYVVLASDDDIYEPDYLRKMDILVNMFPKANVFRPLISHIDEFGAVCMEESFASEGPSLISQSSFLKLFSEKIFLSGLQQYMFRRQALMQIGGFVDFPRAWFSDDATVLRVSRETGIAVYPQVLFKFRIWNGSISGESYNGSSAREKAKAAVSYSMYLDKYAESDSATIDTIKYRAKYLTFQQFSSGSLFDMVKGVIFLIRTRSPLFPFRWLAMMFCSSIKHRFICKRNVRRKNAYNSYV